MTYINHYTGRCAARERNRDDFPNLYIYEIFVFSINFYDCHSLNSVKSRMYLYKTQLPQTSERIEAIYNTFKWIASRGTSGNHLGIHYRLKKVKINQCNTRTSHRIVYGGLRIHTHTTITHARTLLDRPFFECLNIWNCLKNKMRKPYIGDSHAAEQTWFICECPSHIRRRYVVMCAGWCVGLNDWQAPNPEPITLCLFLASDGPQIARSHASG